MEHINIDWKKIISSTILYFCHVVADIVHVFSNWSKNISRCKKLVKTVYGRNTHWNDLILYWDSLKQTVMLYQSRTISAYAVFTQPGFLVINVCSANPFTFHLALNSSIFHPTHCKDERGWIQGFRFGIGFTSFSFFLLTRETHFSLPSKMRWTSET